MDEVGAVAPHGAASAGGLAANDGRPRAPRAGGPAWDRDPVASAGGLVHDGGSRRRRRLAPGVIAGAAALGAWAGTVRIFDIPPYLLPAPHDVILRLVADWSLLVADFGLTALEATAGFLLASVSSFCLASLFVHYQPARAALMPYLIGLKAVPLIAMAPLLVLWLGNGVVSKIAMAALVCFFPIVVNLARGLSDVPPEQLELMTILSANRRQVFTRIRLPNALPYLFAALKIASTLAVVGAIVAEFSGANGGIGYVILIAALRLDTDMLVGGILLATLLGLLLYYAIEAVERRVVYWRAAID